MTLSISLLGPLQLTYQNKVVSNLDTIKAKALLAYLAMTPEQKHERTTLGALLWPEQMESVARNNLRQTVYRLNKYLPTAVASPLLTTRSTLRLDTTACWVDVQIFQTLWHTCQKHAHAALDQCPACAHRLEELVALYRAPFLDDLLLPDCAAYEQWLMQQQEWFQAKTQLAYQTLVKHYARQHVDTALAYCRRWVTLDPYNEEAQRQLMQLLAQKGQRGLALVQYEALRKLLGEELNITPTVETTAVYEMIKRGQAPAHPVLTADHTVYRLHSLPTQLFGREAEMACVAQWLTAPACRLITLAGLPGSGTSALALESARAQAGQFAHGVLSVSLCDVRDELGFWQAIATALDLPQYTPEQIRHNATAVFAQQQLLLLLDNWHTPLPAVAASLPRLLHDAPSLKIMVTSHARLQLADEWLLILTGLTPPQPAQKTEAEITANAAVRLFWAHVQRVRRDLTPTQADWLIMADICRQLDGNPQALILLAASARLLDLPRLHQDLRQHGLQTMGLDSFVAQMTHRWHTLTASMRQQCAALAIFAPDSTTAALQAVCDLQLADMAQLVESALLTQADGVAHFSPLWQQFVRTQQQPAPEIRQAHARYYETLLAGQVGALRQQDQRTAVRQLSQAQENIVQAWQFLAKDHGRVRPLAAWGLFHFYDITGQVAEAQQLLALPPATPLLQAMQGWFTFRAGQVGMAHHLLLEQAAQLSGERERQTQALVRCYTAVVLNQLGDLEGAERELRQAWLVSQQLGDLWTNGFALNIAGDIAFARADLNKAGELYQQSLTLKRIVQDDWGQAYCLMNLGQVAYAQQKYDEAAYYYQQGLDLRRFIGDVRRTATCLAQLGHVARQTNDYATAQSHYQASYHIYEQFQDVPHQIQALLWVARAQQEAEAHGAALRTYREGLALAVGQQQGQQVVEILLTLHHLQVEMAHLGWKQGEREREEKERNTAVSTREELVLQNVLAHFNLLRQRHQQPNLLRTELQQFVQQLFPAVPPHLSLRL